MSERAARDLVWFSLVGAMISGGLIVLFGFNWLPVYQAHTVDVILSREELSDPKLIEVVYRTHRHNAKNQASLVRPYQVLGTISVGLAAAGMIGLLRWQRPSMTV